MTSQHIGLLVCIDNSLRSSGKAFNSIFGALPISPGWILMAWLTVFLLIHPQSFPGASFMHIRHKRAPFHTHPFYTQELITQNYYSVIVMNYMMFM